MNLMKTARWLEILLGITFVFSALSKTVDLAQFAGQVKAYGLVPEGVALRGAALAIVTVETLLGMILMAGLSFKGWTLKCTATLLLVFSALLLYAWAFRDLEDCGCFGAFIGVGAGVSLLKNLMLLAMLGIIWFARIEYASPTKSPAYHRKLPRAQRMTLGFLALIVVGLGAILGDNKAFFSPSEAFLEAGPYAGVTVAGPDREYDLGEGDYFVALLSATCDHCQDAVVYLNEVALVLGDDMPVVGLVQGDEASLDTFISLTEPLFPTQLVDDLFFFEHIGRLPPRFVVVHDGQVRRFLDALEPGAETLLALVTGQASVAE
ncbi:MAG: hypothetical protein KJ052_05400 [Candidatus Hydrogenedentes bacterium]|nr:hypothetical protein [Candidatus Hydrogenedentota bacterium]